MGGLKDPLEVRVEHETCRTIHVTRLEGILSQFAILLQFLLSVASGQRVASSKKPQKKYYFLNAHNS